MKKTSTARGATKNLQGKLTIGLDLGDRSSWYCVLDKAGKVIGEQKVSTTQKAIREVFAAMPCSRGSSGDRDTVTVGEPALRRIIIGHEGIVAHARNVRLIGESRRKDDRLDAQTLARLARIDPRLLASVKHRSAQAQADLMVIRARASLVLSISSKLISRFGAM